MNPERQDRLLAYHETASRAAALAAVAVGGGVLVGWTFDHPMLKSLLPGWVSMKANTALAFVLAGVSLWLVRARSSTRDPQSFSAPRHGVALACAAAAAAIGLLTLIEYGLGVNLGLDQLLFHEPAEAIGTSHPGRMAPVTAVNFLLLGLALLFLGLRSRGDVRLSQWLCAPAFAFSLLAFIGYLYDVQPLYRVASYTQMAGHTSAGFLVLSAGVLLARPDQGFMIVFTNHGPRGLAARRLLPAAVVVPILVGCLALAGHRAGFCDHEFSLALTVLGSIGILSATTWWTAESLHQADMERKRAGMLVQTERNKAEQYLDIAEVILVAFDDHARITLLNRKGHQVLGYAEGELVGRNWFDVVLPPEETKAAFEVYRQVMTGNLEPMERCENHVLTQAGERRLIAWRNSALKDEAGRIMGTLSSGEDITERKRAETALRDSEGLYHSLVENLPQSVFRKDREGRFLFCNQRLCETVGRSLQEIIGKTDADLFPSQLAEAYRQDDLGVMESGQALDRMEEFVGADGRKSFVQVVKTPLRDASGGVIGVQGIFWDITDRVQTEKSHVRLATAVEQAAETVMITDADGAIQYVNPAFETTTGYTRQEAIGRTPRILKSGKHDDAFYKQMWATLGRGEVWTGRFINKRKDGTLYEVERNISPIRDADGRIVNYVSVGRDVTREAQLEDQLRQAQKMESVGRLAGGVAHDFNNLLTAILGYSDMTLKALPVTHPLRAHIEEVRAAGERAAALTRQLLAFSRKQVLQPQVLSLNDLVGNLSRMLHRLIGEDILLATVSDPAAGHVKADPGQIEQVITNLAVNARDAMPEGGTLTLQTANADLDAAYASQHAEVTPGRYVLLTVKDTGTGMTDEVKAHLFEPFFTTKGQGKGTGLGLPTVYGIVKQSGGHLAVYSEVGHGTEFKIYLPRVEEAAEVAIATKAPAELPRGTETILLVEDEDQVRNLARSVLEECGYTVLAAGSGTEALFLAKQHKGKLHLLLTDMIMPGINGRVLAGTLQPQNPAMRFIFMSGYTDTSILPREMHTEDAAFLQKPFTLEVLARKVRDVLDAPAGGGTPRKGG
ncbi:MAG: PAS domain S-box protein [Verrucomicrobia bacterium]|nr:PAS domain S-box protein [Verrucomicrobiota bacterium]